MTRYTQLQKKKHVKSSDFNVTPLQPRRDASGESSNLGKRQRNDTDIPRKQRPVKKGKSDTVCFACRKKGHSVAECKEAKKGPQGICYNCGSTEHSLKQCKRPKKGNGFTYAKCFLCGGEGHLTGQCPKNEKGLYPNGGSCKICGQVDHYAKDCKLTREQVGTMMVGKIDLDQGADDDDYHILVTEKRKAVKKEKPSTEKTKPAETTQKKIVRF